MRERLAPPIKGSAGDREDYAALGAFYAEGDGQPVWTTRTGLTQRANDAIAELSKADDWGLRAADYAVPAIDSAASFEMLADAEIKLGVAVLKYGRHARGGRLDPPSISRCSIRSRPSTIPRPCSRPSLPPMRPTRICAGFIPSIRNSSACVRPCWPRAACKARTTPRRSSSIPAGPAIKPGQEHAQIALLRQRLATPAEGDGKETLYDDALADAVKAVQVAGRPESERHHQRGDAHRAQWRRAADVRRQVRSGCIVNMERWRWMPENLGRFLRLGQRARADDQDL